MVNIGKKKAAVIAPSETKLVTRKITRNIITHPIAVLKLMAKMIPINVATPLPLETVHKQGKHVPKQHWCVPLVAYL